jgi:hypothetical protein
MRPGVAASSFFGMESRSKELTMTNVIDIRSARRELARRASNGIAVRLLWNSSDDTVSVEILDERTEEQFDFRVPSDRALDAFNHPVAYCGHRRSEAEDIVLEAA